MTTVFEQPSNNKLKEFIDFNSHCPICNNKLSLYLRLQDSDLFELTLKNDSLGKYYCQKVEHGKRSNYESFYINDNLDKYQTFYKIDSFNDLFYGDTKFIMLCNAGAIEKISPSKWNWSDSYINIFKTCYYRESFWYQSDKLNYDIKLIDPDHNNYDNIFVIQENFIYNNNKIYNMEFNYLANEIYVSIKNDDNKKYHTLPMIEKRLDFSDKEKIITKIESLLLFI